MFKPRAPRHTIAVYSERCARFKYEISAQPWLLRRRRRARRRCEGGRSGIPLGCVPLDVKLALAPLIVHITDLAKYGALGPPHVVHAHDRPAAAHVPVRVAPVDGVTVVEVDGPPKGLGWVGRPLENLLGPIPDEGGNQSSSEFIRGNQCRRIFLAQYLMREAIRVHQSSSEFIRVNQRQSVQENLLGPSTCA